MRAFAQVVDVKGDAQCIYTSVKSNLGDMIEQKDETRKIPDFDSDCRDLHLFNWCVSH